MQVDSPPVGDPVIKAEARVHPVWWRWFIALRDAVASVQRATLALGSISGANAVTATGFDLVTATLSNTTSSAGISSRTL